MHWFGGETILMVSLLTELIAGGTLVIHLIRTKK